MVKTTAANTFSNSNWGLVPVPTCVADGALLSLLMLLLDFAVAVVCCFCCVAVVVAVVVNAVVAMNLSTRITDKSSPATTKLAVGSYI